MRPGEKVQLGVWRQNRLLDLTITLGERKPNFVAEKQNGRNKNGAAATVLGLSVRAVEGGEEAQALGLQKPHGLLILEVTPGSAASQIDIQPGDVIEEANQQAVNTADQFKTVVAGSKQKGLVMLLIKRQGHNFFRAVTLDKQ